mmetsp:Transcript_20670/g.57101  ORF Transcript_20670/g.57101 Transcript_20670/m.57101 type:complete len:101 (-) Transcript_20670:73-375(-)
MAPRLQASSGGAATDGPTSERSSGLSPTSPVRKSCLRKEESPDAVPRCRSRGSVVFKEDLPEIHEVQSYGTYRDDLLEYEVEDFKRGDDGCCCETRCAVQ